MRLSSFRLQTLVAVLLLWASPAAAQSIGVKGGLDLSNLSLPEGRFAEDVTAQPGFTGGGLVRFGLGSRLGVQAEVLFSQKRSTLDETITHDVDMLEVPVLLRYRVFSAGGRPVHAFGGGFYGSVLSATETVLDQSFDLKPGISSSDYGAVVGGDIDIWNRLSIDGRYIYGMAKIYNTTGERIGTRWSIQVAVAYRLFGS